jgi:hypothetical protein
MSPTADFHKQFKERKKTLNASRHFLLPSRTPLPISSAAASATTDRSRPAPATPRVAQHRPGTTSSSSTDSMPRNHRSDAPRRTLAAMYPVLLVPPDPCNATPGPAPSAKKPWRRGCLSRRCAVGSSAALRRARQTASRSWPMQLGGRCTPATWTGRRRREPWTAAHADVLHASPLRRGRDLVRRHHRRSSPLCKDCCARGFPVAGHVKPPFVRR